MMLLDRGSRGATFFLNDFDLKLHLRLAEFLIDVIRVSGHSQLVFTSHNPALIDRSNLRREQIVFVNKHSDGSSELVALSDYEGLDENTDLQKAYLQGRFDAVPYIGDPHSVVEEIMEK